MSRAEAATAEATRLFCLAASGLPEELLRVAGCESGTQGDWRRERTKVRPVSVSGQKRCFGRSRATSGLPRSTDRERSRLPYIVTTLKVVVRMILCSSRTPEIPCSNQKFPRSVKYFPVNVSREFHEKPLQHRGFLHQKCSGRQKIVNFPVSGEFGWRQVRSALRRQPASPVNGHDHRGSRERPANGGVFSIRSLSLGSSLPPVGESDDERRSQGRTSPFPPCPAIFRARRPTRSTHLRRCRREGADDLGQVVQQNMVV